MPTARAYPAVRPRSDSTDAQASSSSSSSDECDAHDVAPAVSLFRQLAALQMVDRRQIATMQRHIREGRHTLAHYEAIWGQKIRLAEGKRLGRRSSVGGRSVQQHQSPSSPAKADLRGAAGIIEKQIEQEQERARKAEAAAAKANALLAQTHCELKAVSRAVRSATAELEELAGSTLGRAVFDQLSIVRGEPTTRAVSRLYFNKWRDVVHEEASASVCGGASLPQQADAQIQGICDAVRERALKMARAGGWNGLFTEFTAESYLAQVVAGTNYFIKVRTGRGRGGSLDPQEYIHLRVYQHFRRATAPQLVAVRPGLRGGDALQYFEQAGLSS
jgi:hypothetical protein